MNERLEFNPLSLTTNNVRNIRHEKPTVLNGKWIGNNRTDDQWNDCVEGGDSMYFFPYSPLSIV